MSLKETDLFHTENKLARAIARIKTYCTGKKTLVAFSGGKDSQCCYHLCQDAGVEFTAQYSITRFEPPELIQFIRENYPDVVFRRAYTMPLIDEIEYRGLPNRWFRWCCKAKHVKTPGFDISIVGVRAEESPRRRANWRTFGRKQDGQWYCCPIFDWTTAEVWEYLDGQGLPHCSLYDEGFRRIGCVCCPLATQHMRGDAERWPKTAAMLYAGHLKNWQKAINNDGVTKTGRFYKMLEWGTPRAAFEQWLDTGMTIKTKGDEPADEPCLFAGTGFSESDSPNGQEAEP